MKHILVLVLLLAGCTPQQPIILLEPMDRALTQDQRRAMESAGRRPHVTLWYTAEELDWIAQDYAKREHIDFDFRGIQPLVWVSRDTDHLVIVEY